MREKNKYLNYIKRHIGMITMTAVILLIWENAVNIFKIKEYLLPPPTKIFYAFITRFDIIIQASIFTIQEILGGYILAILVSIPLAISVVRWEFVEKNIYPIIVFLQIIPKIAIAPLFIIWLGFGIAPKLLVVFLLCFFPIVVSSVSGFKSIDPDITDFARTTGVSGLRFFFRIILPQALPEIFTGLKIGAALSATAAIVAEFVASDKGLGYLLQQYNGQMETSLVFAIIFLLSTIGLFVFYIVEWIERLVIPWHVSQRRPDIGTT